MNSSDKTIIFTAFRSITGPLVKSLVEQMSFLKKYEKTHSIIFISSYKTEAPVQYIREVTGLRIDKHISLSDEYEDIVLPKTYPSWNHLYDALDVSHLGNNVTDVFIFGSLLSSACGMNRESNKLNHFVKTSQQMNFVANGRLIHIACVLSKLSNNLGVPLHEICYDPCENSLALLDKTHSFRPKYIRCYHGYDSKYFGFERLDSLSYYLDDTSGFEFERTKKKHDITFGMTVITDAREAVYQKIRHFLDSNSHLRLNFLLKHKDLGIDNLVDRDTYLDMIADSRYTFIAPPYDQNQFSVYRFQESLANDCLPLIFEDVRIDEFEESFGVDLSPLKILYDDVKIPDEATRVELLEYFKNKCLKIERLPTI